jgi:hypothetical protein
VSGGAPQYAPGANRQEVAEVRIRVSALVVVSLVALGAGVASATTIKYDTAFKKFEFQSDASGGEFKGKLASRKGACIKQRKVKLIRKHSGNEQKLGSDKTNGKGKWDIDLSTGQLKNGKYFAEVTKKDLGGDGEKEVCLADKSGKIEVSG